MATDAQAAAADQVSKYRWLILLGLITAAIMEVLDTTIVNVSLPQMAGNLGATFQEVAWVSTGYILANVVVLPMTAFLAATFGRRNYLTASIIIFIAASFLCGTSHTLGELVLWRVLQGAGGAALLSTAQATLRQISAALNGSLRNAQFRTDKYFGFAVPTALEGVPSDILDPVNTWKDKAEFDVTARKLVGMFQKNFAKFEAHVDAEVRAAAPDVKIAAE